MCENLPYMVNYMIGVSLTLNGKLNPKPSLTPKPSLKPNPKACCNPNPESVSDNAAF